MTRWEHFIPLSHKQEPKRQQQIQQRGGKTTQTVLQHKPSEQCNDLVRSWNQTQDPVAYQWRNFNCPSPSKWQDKKCTKQNQKGRYPWLSHTKIKKTVWRQMEFFYFSRVPYTKQKKKRNQSKLGQFIGMYFAFFAWYNIFRWSHTIGLQKSFNRHVRISRIRGNPQ